ncbi:MAG: GTP-binding protein [Syntrophobacteraceae bacterium]|nr:GTP-binding protein [Syntrophobacteraceae bacterium]
MQDTIDIVLLTGFLGSGKTTFLNRLVEVMPREYRVVILMNEFGEIGIDASIVKGDDHEILEINKGSIFCVCVKTDFIRTMHRIACDLRPDVLVIESTGVANPGDLRRDLSLSVFQNRFSLIEQICIVDAVNFEDAYNAFSSVEKQIESSTLFIINKADQASADRIRRVREIVSQHHPSPVFVESVFCGIDFDRLLSKLRPPGQEREYSFDAGRTGGSLTPDELDQIVDGMLSDPFRQISRPDLLVSAAYAWHGGSTEEFSKVLQDLPRGIVRGKGFVSDCGRTYLVNLVMEQWELEEVDLSNDRMHPLDRLVFIFPPELTNAVDEVTARHGQLEKLTGGS